MKTKLLNYALNSVCAIAILAFALTLVFVLVIPVGTPAYAEDTVITHETGSPKTGSTTMTYNVASTYSVTIPDAVTINAEKTGSLTVGVAENAFIDYNKSILVKLTTCDFELTNGGDSLTYTITKGTPAAAVAQGGTVLTHGAGNLAASSEVLSIAVTDSAKYSGSYTDSVTFTVTVE